MKKSYEDIINLPHHVSTTHTPMPTLERAAQFSPFAALTGYDAAVKETARLTDKPVELDEDSIAILEMKLQILAGELSNQPEVGITYFQADAKKTGGKYINTIGTIKKIDEFEKVLLMMDGTKIPIKTIIEIECDLFQAYF
ncbi:hypothetical protein Q5O14_11455 [Eubacteriaceae bacterium ES2]|nr:hypothetical protein Q5O14_11455 [Eubacteriaceae bacterium ES2]